MWEGSNPTAPCQFTERRNAIREIYVILAEKTFNNI